MTSAIRPLFNAALALIFLIGTTIQPASAEIETHRPVLLGKHWMAITGKPQGATAGAMMFQQGGNAIDAAAAMLAVTAACRARLLALLS